jgi:glutamine synthetase
VDEYQDLLRVSVASAGNDHRLGANEAPPAIVSIFVGEELNGILDALEAGSDYHGKERIQMEIGATVLPHFPKDTTDRNRTSPFAFTGNKFEYRMLGSAFSISGPNFILNTAVADVLCQFADQLENSSSFIQDLGALIKKTIKEHKRIIFNGNGYDDAWVKEAERRGLSNLKTTPEAMPCYLSKKNVDALTRHQVLTEQEIHSRYEIFLENYCKTINIEALAMIDIVNQEIIPSVFSYQNDLAKLISRKKSLGKDDFPSQVEEVLLKKLSHLSLILVQRLEALSEQTIAVRSIEDSLELAKAYRDKVFAAMSELRVAVDELEMIVSKKHWTLPTYAEILYSVN